MCKKCGCNTCETKSTTLVLNESKASRTILSEGLKHHIDANRPLTDNFYSAGSKDYFDLIAEARSLYSRGILEFTNKRDIELLTETDQGYFGIYEGKKVPLDFPMLNEIEIGDVVKIDKAYGGGKGEVKDKKGSFVVVNGSSYHESDVKLIKESSDYDEIANDEFGMDYDQLGSNEKEWVQDEYDNMSWDLSNSNEGLTIKEEMVDYDFSKEELIRVIKQLKRGASTEVGMIKAFEKALGRELTDDEIRGFKLKESKLNEDILDDAKAALENEYDWTNIEFEGDLSVRFDYDRGKNSMWVNKSGSISGNVPSRNARSVWKALDKLGLKENKLTEAKFKGKTVDLNKPTRGDSKKFKVYVNSGKKNADGSIKVKKVNFGHGGTTAKKAGQKTMKIRKSNPKARAAFRARHNCSNPGPKTMARYWSCKKW